MRYVAASAVTDRQTDTHTHTHTHKTTTYPSRMRRGLKIHLIQTLHYAYQCDRPTFLYPTVCLSL